MSEIEVEAKFTATPEILSKIQAKCKLESTKELRDRYFDTPDFKLMKQDWWLRFRNDNFELKCLSSVCGT